MKKKALILFFILLVVYIFLGAGYMFVSWVEGDLTQRVTVLKERGVVTTAKTTTTIISSGGSKNPVHYSQEVVFEVQNPDTKQPQQYRCSVPLDSKDAVYDAGVAFDVVYDPTNPELNSLASILEKSSTTPDPVIPAIKKGIIGFALFNLLVALGIIFRTGKVADR